MSLELEGELKRLNQQLAVAADARNTIRHSVEKFKNSALRKCDQKARHVEAQKRKCDRLLRHINQALHGHSAQQHEQALGQFLSRQQRLHELHRKEAEECVDFEGRSNSSEEDIVLLRAIGALGNDNADWRKSPVSLSSDEASHRNFQATAHSAKVAQANDLNVEAADSENTEHLGKVESPRLATPQDQFQNARESSLLVRDDDEFNFSDSDVDSQAD
ncbi:MAG: hypothetical protein MHM6MM_002416 [Cercozoa sp. M6MM]